MGASGAGKTTLLNMICDRIDLKQGSSMSRKVMINDSEEMNQSNFGTYGAYVMQDDMVFRFFTPKEAIKFAARLKLTIPKDEQKMRIRKLI